MNKAIIAGNFPTPKKGIIKAKSASDGTVCNALVILITTLATFGVRVSKMPKGTAMTIPKANAITEMYKCSALFDSI